MMNWRAYIRYYRAWWRWFLRPPYRIGDPMYGEGEDRMENIYSINKEWQAREPKRENYGLPAAKQKTRQQPD